MKFASIKAAMYFFAANLAFTFIVSMGASSTSTEESEWELWLLVFILSAMVAGFVFFKTLHDTMKAERGQSVPMRGTGCE